MVQNVGEKFTTKKYCPSSLTFVVSKIFEKVVNDRLVDHLEKCGLFSDSYYSFMSSQSTADLPAVVSDRTVKAFHRYRAARAVALGVAKAFDRV